MDLKIEWQKTIQLKHDSSSNYIFEPENIDDIPQKPGIYMFCRLFGSKLIPLYIGKAQNIKSRIEQQIDKLTLMKAIEKAENGKKVLVVGVFIPKKKQDTDKCIRIIEQTLIEQALIKGFEIINEKGTKKPYHSIAFSGNRPARNFSEKIVYAEIKKAKDI